jgi:hypothetical protein
MILVVKSDLEILVERDMVENGYDPSNQYHIEKYWDERLPREEEEDND